MKIFKLEWDTRAAATNAFSRYNAPNVKKQINLTSWAPLISLNNRSLSKLKNFQVVEINFSTCIIKLNHNIFVFFSSIPPNIWILAFYKILVLKFSFFSNSYVAFIAAHITSLNNNNINKKFHTIVNCIHHHQSVLKGVRLFCTSMAYNILCSFSFLPRSKNNVLWKKHAWHHLFLIIQLDHQKSIIVSNIAWCSIGAKRMYVHQIFVSYII